MDPALPADWAGFGVTRRFRGTTYHISVEKPAGAAGRVTALEVDGTMISGNLIPLPSEAGSTVEVRARIEGG